jgi:fructose-1,6-bisphosphatase I
MKSTPTLTGYLDRYSEGGPRSLSVATAVDAIATASIDIADLIGRGALAGITGKTTGINADGDAQKDLDIRADERLRAALSSVRLAALASEEAAEAALRDPSAAICVALDPLDGSSNIEANMTVGTIFSITATPPDLSAVFRQSGAAQLAAGFVVYGPQTSLVLTVGDGVDIFTLDRIERSFKLVREQVRIPVDTPEYAINASNQRHWEPPVRAFIDQCLAGTEGPRSRDFNMRWLGSLVAETYRILARGGVFLYPADSRPGYGNGRLRLVYEAHPIAFIVEQAGGAASTGRERILDLVPGSLHQRVPLILGSIDKVRRVEQLHLDPEVPPEMTAPLFAHRGFFRVQS